MTWYLAVGLTLAIVAGWGMVWAVGDRLSHLFQQRMTATLWSSLPSSPGRRARNRQEAKEASPDADAS